MQDLSRHADKTLQFLERSGLDPEETGLVAAAVLCAVTVEVETAHRMVEYIDTLAKLAATKEEVEKWTTITS